MKKRIRRLRKDGIKQHYHINVLAKKIKKRLIPLSKKIDLAGSIRRGKTPTDIDIVLIPKNKERIIRSISKIGKIKSKGSQQVFANVEGTDVDLFFASSKDYGAQLMTRTGPAGSNISHRATAKRKGWKLNQYGLFDRRGQRIASTEKGIYNKLGLHYRKPELRGTPR